jgi:hypothetical protein
MSSSGRVKLALRCRKVGTGTAPGRCTGSVSLTATIGARKRTIGTATFNFARTATKNLLVRLTSTARRTITRSTRAALTMTVPNGRLPSRKTTRSVRILPRLR